MFIHWAAIMHRRLQDAPIVLISLDPTLGSHARAPSFSARNLTVVCCLHILSASHLCLAFVSSARPKSGETKFGETSGKDLQPAVAPSAWALHYYRTYESLKTSTSRSCFFCSLVHERVAYYMQKFERAAHVYISISIIVKRK